MCRMNERLHHETDHVVAHEPTFISFLRDFSRKMIQNSPEKCCHTDHCRANVLIYCILHRGKLWNQQMKHPLLYSQLKLKSLRWHVDKERRKFSDEPLNENIFAATLKLVDTESMRYAKRDEKSCSDKRNRKGKIGSGNLPHNSLAFPICSNETRLSTII